jgi:hypothetical protein
MNDTRPGPQVWGRLATDDALFATPIVGASFFYSPQFPNPNPNVEASSKQDDDDDDE